MERRDEGTRRKRSPRSVSRGLLLALFIAAASCDSDIFNLDVKLAGVSLSADLGASQGTIPAIACNPAVPAACGASQTVDVTTSSPISDVSVTPGCDAATSQCFADASVRLVQQVDVLQDDAFVTRVERGSTSFVKMVDIGYTMPVNTLNFDVPGISIYVGPAGTSRPGDVGVVLVDTIPAIPAGTTFTDRRHLSIPEGSPAASLIEQKVSNKQPFVFILVTTPRVQAGAPLPGGAFEIDLYPTVQLGL